jgi:hypothetical protein
MEKYWKTRPRASASVPAHSVIDLDPDIDDTGRSSQTLSDYDLYRQSLVTKDDNEGWASEKRRYLKDMPADVTKDTDIVEWWQVSPLLNVVCPH